MRPVAALAAVACNSVNRNYGDAAGGSSGTEGGREEAVDAPCNENNGVAVCSVKGQDADEDGHFSSAWAAQAGKEVWAKRVVAA